MEGLFDKIKNRLVFWFLLISLLPLIFVISFSYLNEIREMERAEFSKLQAVRELKEERISSWLEEREGDLRVTSNDFDLTDLESVIDTEGIDETKRQIFDQAREILRNYRATFRDYNEIYVMDPKSGEVLISTNQENEGISKALNEIYLRPRETQSLFIKDVYFSTESNDFAMGMSIPIFCRQHAGKHLIGILAVRIDLNYSLYPLLRNRTGLGKTGETLLVNSNQYVLNDLRWHENAILELKIDATPAYLAAKGKSGIVKADDYRGERVLAAYGTIARTNWGLVCKRDTRELNEPAIKLLIQFLLLLAVSSIVIFIVSVLLSRTISKPISKLQETAQSIEQGNYDSRIELRNKDELGDLASSVNQMAASIEKQIKIEEGFKKISGSVTGQNNIDEYCRSLIKILQDLTGAVQAVFYIKRRDVFEHIHSVGANEHLRRKILIDNPVGEFSTVLAAGRIYHFTEISETDNFTYSTIAGEVKPSELLAIPVLVGKKSAGLISLAQLGKFSEESLGSINLSWQIINQSFGNLLKAKKTEELAQELQLSNEQLKAQSEELAAQGGELRKQAEELQHHTAQLQEQNQELEAQKKEVMQADNIKSEFLATMSHELRTPLNSVLSLSQLILDKARERLQEDEQEFLGIILRNGKSLLHLINDLLDLSKIESGKLEIIPGDLQLSSFFGNIKDMFDPLAKEKGLNFGIDITGREGKIVTDEQRLYQIMQNLTGNAIKFTDQGYVKVKVTSRNELLKISVEDSGRGIEPEQLDVIFDKFRQGDGSTSRNYEGTGLGLAITNKLVELLHGRINVLSTPGKGSIFTVFLPLKWQGKEEVNLLSYEEIRQSIDENLANYSRKAKILLVEDNESAIIQVRNQLKKHNYEVAVCRNGRDALEYVSHTIPDGIILDLMMPEIDGFEVLERIRGSKATREIPVLILTAKDLSKKDLQRLSANNIQQLVQKGDINLADLMQKINLMIFGSGNLDSEKPEARKEEKKEKKKKPQILVIEPNIETIKQIKKAISSEYEVVISKNGIMGIQDAIALRPALMIVDEEQPQMSGIELCLMLKTRKETHSIPVIVVSEKSYEELKNELDESACEGFIRNPFVMGELVNKIEELIIKN